MLLLPVQLAQPPIMALVVLVQHARLGKQLQVRGRYLKRPAQFARLAIMALVVIVSLVVEALIPVL